MQSTLFQNLKKFDSAIAVVDDYGSAFTYSELDHDVEKMAANLSIKNSMSFDKDSDGIDAMFAEEFQGRRHFYKNIREKKDFKENYFNKAEEFMKSLENDTKEPVKTPKKSNLWDKIMGKNDRK